MIIRRMQETDIDQVYSIEEITFTQPWSRDDFIECTQSTYQHYFVAESEGEIVAYCGLADIAGEGWINNVAVAKAHQNKKIGFQMLKALLDEMDRKGLERYTLEVRVSNAAAIHLYKKLGFKESGIRKGFYDLPREDALIMWRTDE